jgi:hypothetical protein
MTGGPHRHSIGQTETGIDLAPQSIARLACDATLRRVTLGDDGVPINVGRKYRTATDPQWAVHEGGWSVKLVPDRTLEIFKLDGGHHATVEPPQRC